MFTFMTHFGENKIWQQKIFFLSLTRIDFAVGFSSRAVSISSSGPITSTRKALIRDLFSCGFPRTLRAGPYGSYDNGSYLVYKTKLGSPRSSWERLALDWLTKCYTNNIALKQ